MRYYGHLVHPHIGGHHLVLQVNIDQLRELQAESDSQSLCEVGHRPDEAVVVMEEVIVQPLGVRIALNTLDESIQYIIGLEDKSQRWGFCGYKKLRSQEILM